MDANSTIPENTLILTKNLLLSILLDVVQNPNPLILITHQVRPF